MPTAEIGLMHFRFVNLAKFVFVFALKYSNNTHNITLQLQFSSSATKQPAHVLLVHIPQLPHCFLPTHGSLLKVS